MTHGAGLLTRAAIFALRRQHALDSLITRVKLPHAMEPPIQSSRNPVVRRFRRTSAGAFEDLMVAEGLRLVADVLTAGRDVVEVAWSPRLIDRPDGSALLARLRKCGATLHDCADRVLQQLSHLKTHQGVSVILRRPTYCAADLLVGGEERAANPLVVVAAGVRDPGNLGAIVRAAEAAGATGVVALDAADPFRDKAVRGSSGSIFRMPCISQRSADETVAFAREHGLQIVVADNAASEPCWDADLLAPTLLVFGSEGGGVPEDLVRAADRRVGIPLAAPVESLNVSVAAGVVLFEARRQRALAR